MLPHDLRLHKRPQAQGLAFQFGWAHVGSPVSGTRNPPTQGLPGGAPGGELEGVQVRFAQREVQADRLSRELAQIRPLPPGEDPLQGVAEEVAAVIQGEARNRLAVGVLQFPLNRARRGGGEAQQQAIAAEMIGFVVKAPPSEGACMEAKPSLRRVKRRSLSPSPRQYPSVAYLVVRVGDHRLSLHHAPALVVVTIAPVVGASLAGTDERVPQRWKTRPSRLDMNSPSVRAMP